MNRSNRCKRRHHIRTQINDTVHSSLAVYHSTCTSQSRVKQRARGFQFQKCFPLNDEKSLSSFSFIQNTYVINISTIHPIEGFIKLLQNILSYAFLWFCVYLFHYDSILCAQVRAFSNLYHRHRCSFFLTHMLRSPILHYYYVFIKQLFDDFF